MVFCLGITDNKAGFRVGKPRIKGITNYLETVENG